MSDGEFIKHIGCIFGCGSSDALAIYRHPDRSFSGYCWSCYKSSPLIESEDGWHSTAKQVREERELSQYTMEDINAFRNRGWQDRLITKVTARMYGVKALEQDGQINSYFYPNYRDGRLVGYKIRRRFISGDPEVQEGKVEAGTFKCFKGYVGNNKKGIQLFGQYLHSSAPRRVFILGGQEDAMAAYQFIQNRFDNIEPGQVVPGWAFVSPQNGENDSDIKLQLPWFETAEEIYLCFDEDDAGSKCTEKVAALFDPKKVKIMSLADLGVKDTSDAYRKGLKDQWWSAIWNSRPYSPVGITSYADALEAMKERGGWQLIPFPDSFGNLNDRTLGGYGLGEIVNIIGPTSIGKSSLTNEMVYKAIKATDYNIGVITLEADIVQYAEQMNSLELDYRLVEVPHNKRNWEEIAKAHKVFGERIYLIEDMGAIRDAEMFWDKVNFLVSGLDCKIIVFDPATLGIKAARMNEDEYLADLVTFVKRKNIAWVNACHTRKTPNDQQAASEGSDVTEEDTKGSSAWIQNAMINLVVSRDKLHEVDEVKNTTKIKVPKIRRNGAGTGIAGYVLYDVNTGRLVPGRAPKDIMGK